MTIRKNDFIGTLKQRIVEVSDVSVVLPRGKCLSVQLVTDLMIADLLHNNPRKRGIPEVVAIENGQNVRVFPRTDKRYRLRVLGTQYIEQ